MDLLRVEEFTDGDQVRCGRKCPGSTVSIIGRRSSSHLVARWTSIGDECVGPPCRGRMRLRFRWSLDIRRADDGPRRGIGGGLPSDEGVLADVEDGEILGDDDGTIVL